MFKNLIFLLLALALIILFIIIFDFLFKLLFKYEDKFLEKRKKEQEKVFTQQRNMGYNEWKNPYNTKTQKDEFPNCLKDLGFNTWPQNIDEIKDRYRTLAKENHPDIKGGSSEAFEKINKAYKEAINLDKYRS